MKNNTTEKAYDQKLQDFKPEEKPNLRGDRLNVLLLTFLYVLQMIPVGFGQAIPFILQNRGVKYEDQAEFSFATYAFCFKILWAPIVDCTYSIKIGRRKSWIVPSQYLMGLSLIFMSMNIDDWLGDEFGGKKPKIRILTLTIFLCVLFSATQDIAVDGWSLTMLQKRNVGHSGTCNSVGSICGIFLGYVLFIILDSKELCNKFRTVPLDKGFFSFAEFMFAWGIICLITTTLVMIFKRDNSLDNVDDHSELKMSLKESYVHLWKILNVKSIQKLSFLLITCRVAFGPIHGVANLKLMDAGIPKDLFALFSVPLLPFQMFLPFILGRYITGPRCMTQFLTIYVCRLIVGIFFAIFVFFTQYLKSSGTNSLPTWYYISLIIVYSLEQISSNIMSIAQQAFFSRVSDSRFGGIYLTLLNTVSNTGGRWPVSLSLWMIDPLTFSVCKTCKVVDGFYVEVVVATLFGIAWLIFCSKSVKKLEKLSASEWTAEPNSSSSNVIIKVEKLLCTPE